MGMATKLTLLVIAHRADVAGWTRLEEAELGHVVGLSERQIMASIAGLVRDGHAVLHSREEMIFSTRWIEIHDRRQVSTVSSQSQVSQ